MLPETRSVQLPDSTTITCPTHPAITVKVTGGDACRPPIRIDWVVLPGEQESPTDKRREGGGGRMHWSGSGG